LYLMGTNLSIDFTVTPHTYVDKTIKNPVKTW
jgi:hypothetical protein